METWRSVQGFEGQYEVSDMGRVRRCARQLTRSNGHTYRVAEKVLAQVYLPNGYKLVGLKVARKTNRTRLVHRLVAAAFVSNPEDLPEVNHRDLNKENNCASNLEWCTGTGNMEHAAKRGRFHGRTNPNARFKLQPEQVDDILRRLETGEKGVDLAKEFGVSPSLIYMIRSGDAWADPAKVFAHVA